MKKLFLALLLGLSLQTSVFAAIASTAVWEVRPANGADTNGGGYTSGGTDHSQQDGAWAAYTDLVIDATTNTDITSAATPFASDDIGNIIQITGGTGFTTGFYEVKSIPSGVIARLDRAVGTTSSTGGTGNLGGALATVSTVGGSLVAGHKIWIKNEAWNEEVSGLTTNGTASAPITFEGYNTSRGDTPAEADCPTNSRAGAGTVAWASPGDFYIIKNLVMDTPGTVGFQIESSIIINCYVLNAGSYSFSFGGGGFSTCAAYKCSAIGGASNAFPQFVTTGVLRTYGCYAFDCGGYGFYNSGRSYHKFSIAAECTNEGFQCADATNEVINCTSYGNTGSTTDGFEADFQTYESIWLNNISVSNGRDGYRTGSGTYNSPFIDYNCAYGNTGTARTEFPAGANDQDVDPAFVTGTFIPTATELVGGGFAVDFENTASGYHNSINIGAVQTQVDAGGGGTTGHAF